MASYNGHRPYTSSEIHLALLRPAILQILRAQGYYSSTPATIDSLTELAGQYIYTISKRTAQHANSNNYLGPPATPDIVDVRLALEECGALWPGAGQAKHRPSRGGNAEDGDEMLQDYDGEVEDMRGVDEFIQWATGRKNQRIRKIAGVVAPPGAVIEGAEGEDGTVEERPSDYLDSEIFLALQYSLALLIYVN
jgi:transcription initiation factor TFIID subunit 3